MYSARLDLFEFLNPYFKFNYEKSSYQGFIDFYGQSNNAQIKETISGFLDLSICITNNLKKLINEGMVHCDIKPENILIDHDGMPKITDFDMMLHIDKAIGIPQLMGTKGYRKEGLEYRNETTEVYALSKTFYYGEFNDQDFSVSISDIFSAFLKLAKLQDRKNLIPKIEIVSKKFQELALNMRSDHEPFNYEQVLEELQLIKTLL